MTRQVIIELTDKSAEPATPQPKTPDA